MIAYPRLNHQSAWELSAHVTPFFSCRRQHLALGSSRLYSHSACCETNLGASELFKGVTRDNLANKRSPGLRLYLRMRKASVAEDTSLSSAPGAFFYPCTKGAVMTPGRRSIPCYFSLEPEARAILERLAGHTKAYGLLLSSLLRQEEVRREAMRRLREKMNAALDEIAVE
jgi:hypothetical protein